MNSLRIIFIILISFTISNSTYAKNPSDLIKEIVDQASNVLSSDDPVESKIIKLNDIAEKSQFLRKTSQNIKNYLKAIF